LCRLTLDELLAFFRNPAKMFFKKRLKVYDGQDDSIELSDEESSGFKADWYLKNELLAGISQHDLKTKETDEGIADALTELGSEAAEFKARIVTEDVAARLAENFEAKVPARADYTKINTDKWTDDDGKSHELSYSYQEAFVNLMDLVFRENSSVSLMEGLAGKRGALEEAITHLTNGVKLENSGSDPCAEYWAAAQGMHSVLNELTGGEMPVNEEDLYEVVSFAGPVLITIPEGGGEPDTELLTDVIGYSRELTYSHSFDTLIARLKVLAPAK
jgi:hypothetical protein